MIYTLSNENIAMVCQEAERFLDNKKIDSKERRRLVLSFEEVLLTYQKICGEDTVFSVDMVRRINSMKIRLSVKCERIDPFDESQFETKTDNIMRSALVRLGNIPRWTYRRGVNEILFSSAKKRMPDIVKLAIAIGAAVMLGYLVRIAPESVGTLLHKDIIDPLLNTFIGFLNAVAGPLIFLSVLWGINSVGDASTFSEIGKRISLKYAAYMGLVSIIGVLGSLPLFHLAFGQSRGGSGFSDLFRIILDIIPSNFFTSFSSGNTLQILFIAIVVGVVMLVIGKNTQLVADLSEQMGFIVDGIMGFISKLIPAFVFGSLFNIVVSSEFEMIAVGGKYFITTVAGSVVIILFHTAAVWIRTGMAPPTLWKHTLPTFILAITTASSSIALPTNLKTCIEKLGVSKRVANFGVPFGQILYKPGVILLFFFSALSIAENEHVGVSVSWIIIAIVMSAILAAAVPPVPGGVSASFIILFSQLGLGNEILAVILSLSSILDFILTATDIFSTQCVLRIASKKIS